MLEAQGTDLDSVIHVIQISLTPIFLLTAVAGLLGVFTTRLARISDQVTALAKAEAATRAEEDRLARRLNQLRRRSHALDLAVILGAIAGACTCATVLTLFLGALRAHPLPLLRPRDLLHHRRAGGVSRRDDVRRAWHPRRGRTPPRTSGGRPMITVHHLEQSRSRRIVWLLEELGLSYEVVLYRRNPKTMLAPPELKAIHPLGKAPILVEDGIVMIESGAIIMRMIERHGAASGLAPAAGTPEHGDYLTFLHFAEGSMMPPLLLRLIFSRITTMAPALIRPLARAIAKPVETGFIAPNIVGTLDFLEAELGKRPWFAGGAFSGADIQMSFPIEAAHGRGGLDASRPKLMDFLARIHARPAYQRAVARVGA